MCIRQFLIILTYISLNKTEVIKEASYHKCAKDVPLAVVVVKRNRD
jgi:hypothetical protein